MDGKAKDTTDQPVLGHIERVVAEERKLYEQGALGEQDRSRLAKIQVELDQCWDLLRLPVNVRGRLLDLARIRVGPGADRRALRGMRPNQQRRTRANQLCGFVVGQYYCAARGLGLAHFSSPQQDQI